MTRRVFIEIRELPRLLIGVTKGDPVALRRILGARKGGRYGIALAAVAAALAVPAPVLPWLFAAQLAVGLLGGGVSRPPLRWTEYERLSLWLAAPALLPVAALRALGASPAWLAPTAWLVAQLWLMARLRLAVRHCASGAAGGGEVFEPDPGSASASESGRSGGAHRPGVG